MTTLHKNLNKAKKEKNDEFYTRLEDIEAEISQHQDYVDAFQGKTVYCNCDDPELSNFSKFFILHFKQLGLKRLITTHYTGNNILFLDSAPAYKMEYFGEMDSDGNPITHKTPLTSNGDFRSEECVELLKHADIVVTNPPFSLFREYIAQLMEHNKKFVIIGSGNAITYKEIFPYIQEGRMWLGITRKGTGSMWFQVPDDAPVKVGQKVENGIRYQTIGNSCWFTNIDLAYRYESLPLVKNYIGNESDYPKYDNYDAIEVGKSKDIPKDYFGVMGVPITFLGKLCPEQFEIVAFRKGDDDKDLVFTQNGERVQPYFRILIRRK